MCVFVLTVQVHLMHGLPSGLNSSFSLYRRPSKIQPAGREVHKHEPHRSLILDVTVACIVSYSLGQVGQHFFGWILGFLQWTTHCTSASVMTPSCHSQQVNNFFRLYIFLKMDFMFFSFSLLLFSSILLFFPPFFVNILYTFLPSLPFPRPLLCFLFSLLSLCFSLHPPTFCS